MGRLEDPPGRRDARRAAASGCPSDDVGPPPPSPTAATPSSASPTTSMSGSASTIIRRPAADDGLVVDDQDPGAVSRRLEGERTRTAKPRRPRTGLDLAAEQRRALPHAPRVRCRLPLCVSRRRRPGLDPKLASSVGQRARAGSRLGMLQGVGQRLLDDPVGALCRSPGGELHRDRPSTVDVHRQAGAADVLDQPRRAGRKPRLRQPGPGVLVVATEHAHQAPHLGERLHGPFAGSIGATRAPMVAALAEVHSLGPQPRARSCSSRARHVVQLARDPGALLGGGETALLHALAL